MGAEELGRGQHGECNGKNNRVIGPLLSEVIEIEGVGASPKNSTYLPRERIDDGNRDAGMGIPDRPSPPSSLQFDPLHIVE